MRNDCDKMKLLKKTRILVLLLLVLTVIVFLETVLLPTTSRYIKRTKDEIIAHYTSLYINSTGNNRVVTLENNVGYVDFKLMNFVDDNVTQRDIEYVIKTPTKFFDKTGKEIPESNYGQADLYVLDVWKTPQLIGKDTHKYDVTITTNDGEKLQSDTYKFTYEKINNTPIGKNHNITVKLERKETESLAGIEHVSVVVQLTKPYHEVYVINITVSNRIIAFSTADKQNFEIDFKTLYIQTANSYAYVQDNASWLERTAISDQNIKYKNDAIRLTLTWDKAFLNENTLNKLHLGYLDQNESSNIDITKPYIASLSSTLDHGELVIYVPQSSSFSLDFLPNSTNYEIKALIEIATSSGYQVYSLNEFGGYLHENGYYTIYEG